MLLFNQNRRLYPYLRLRLVLLSERSAGDLRAWAKANLSDATKEDMKNVAEFIRAADRALYKAKNEGKDIILSTEG